MTTLADIIKILSDTKGVREIILNTVGISNWLRVLQNCVPIQTDTPDSYPRLADNVLIKVGMDVYTDSNKKLTIVNTDTFNLTLTDGNNTTIMYSDELTSEPKPVSKEQALKACITIMNKLRLSEGTTTEIERAISTAQQALENK